MKLHLRQEIGGRDAQKGAGGQGHCHADDRLLMAAKHAQAGEKCNSTERHDEGIEAVGNAAAAAGHAGVQHQRADDGGIERLVQQHSQERGEPRQPASAVFGVGPHRSGQRRTIGEAMERLGTAEGGTEVALTFFRGSREQLKSIVGADASGAPESVTITLQRPGLPDDQIRVPYGANLRDELVARKINVYQSITRWTNCNGQQLCGTCIVNVAQGLEACTRRSLDESSTLRENPETYKLACITNVYGDITVQLMPKVGAAQWTR